MKTLGGMERVDSGITEWHKNITSKTQNLLFRVQRTITKSSVINAVDYQLLQLHQIYSAGFIETQVH